MYLYRDRTKEKRAEASRRRERRVIRLSRSLAPEEGAKHLLTALTCFLSRKQMQVHTREAIKRKALIPICNCFSISTGLLTGPKSGNTLSLQSLGSPRAPLCVYLPFFFPPPFPRGCVSPLHSVTVNRERTPGGGLVSARHRENRRRRRR